MRGAGERWARRLCMVCCAWALWGCGDGMTERRWRPVAALEQLGWGMNVTAEPGGETFCVVGGTPERGRIWRESEPGQYESEPIPRVPLLNWVHLFEDGTGFAVGNEGAVLRRASDGTWQRQATPTDEDLWGVWGARPDDVWAVGGAGRSEGQATLMRYDGEAWSLVPLPELERPNVWALFKVWGTAADDVWVVGQHGAILHYDGEAWGEHGAGTSEDLIALWGTGPDRILAVGGRSSAVVARYDGEGWESESLAPLPGLNGVWTGDGDTFYVGGIDGTLATLDFARLSYEEDYQETSSAFHSVHGVAGRVLAVGGNLSASQPPYDGLARERETRTE